MPFTHSFSSKPIHFPTNPLVHTFSHSSFHYFVPSWIYLSIYWISVHPLYTDPSHPIHPFFYSYVHLSGLPLIFKLGTQRAIRVFLILIQHLIQCIPFRISKLWRRQVFKKPRCWCVRRQCRGIWYPSRRLALLPAVHQTRRTGNSTLVLLLHIFIPIFTATLTYRNRHSSDGECAASRPGFLGPITMRFRWGFWEVSGWLSWWDGIISKWLDLPFSFSFFFLSFFFFRIVLSVGQTLSSKTTLNFWIILATLSTG